MTINDPIIETEMQDQLEETCNEVNPNEADPNLIGFNNGVYDLRTGEFRDQRPEDCISLTTGNDFMEFDIGDTHLIGKTALTGPRLSHGGQVGVSPVIDTIYHFMEQLFPDSDLCDYVLTLFASFLDGHNPHNKFHILTGLGASGISTLLKLFELAFGKYITHLDSTIFTQNRYQDNTFIFEICTYWSIPVLSQYSRVKMSYIFAKC